MYRYQISQADRLVRIEAHGETDLKSSRQILVTAMADLQFQPEYDFLVDVRAMTSEPPAPDLQAFAEFLGTIKALRGPIVVVASAGLQFGMARIMCAFAQFRNVQMTVFRDEMAAKTWLKSERA